MSAASDTFSRFLDVLADSMDDHTTSSRTLASRVHLSRSLLARLVGQLAMWDAATHQPYDMDTPSGPRPSRSSASSWPSQARHS